MSTAANIDFRRLEDEVVRLGRPRNGARSAPRPRSVQGLPRHRRRRRVYRRQVPGHSGNRVKAPGNGTEAPAVSPRQQVWHEGCTGLDDQKRTAGASQQTCGYSLGPRPAGGAASVTPPGLRRQVRERRPDPVALPLKQAIDGKYSWPHVEA